MCKHLLLIMPLILILLLSACSQNGRYYRKAKKSYEQGNIDAAVLSACRSLRIKPDNGKAQKLLQTVWEQAIANHNNRVEELLESTEVDTWDKVLQEHTRLKELSAQVENLPILVDPETGYRVLLPLPNLKEEIKTSRENAAEAHYQAGLRFAKMSSAIDIQRKAALEFKAAMNFIPDYKDSALKYSNARRLAIRRLAIAPFNDKSNTRGRYGAISELITDYITSRILSGGYLDEFTELIARNQMDAVLAEQQLNASGLVDEASTVNLGQLVGAHEVLTGSILNISVSPARTVSVMQSSKAKVVTGKEQYVDEEGNTKEKEIIGEVSCDFKRYTKSANVTVYGSFSILDVETGRLLMQESIEAKTPWQDSWCRFVSGDERALSRDVKNLMDKSEPFPPEENDMVLSTLRGMGNSVVEKLTGYLK